MSELDDYGVSEAWLEAAVSDPSLVGLTAADLDGKDEAHVRDLALGERCYQLARAAGEVAHRLLFAAQWGRGSPDWMDHRHHYLGHADEWTDFWTISADNVIGVLPFGGSLLNLCAGDAFYDFYFWRRRATEIVCVDINPACHRHYLRLHQAPEITYRLADVLTFQAPADHFDVVVIRGAIEHFSQHDQQRIFRLAHAAMKPGGWFCGDTPAARDTGVKMLSEHEFEWRDADQMRLELSRVFGHVETQTLVSKERTTLLWRARR
jgi:SAM-dependent methyltransferase